MFLLNLFIAFGCKRDDVDPIEIPNQNELSAEVSLDRFMQTYSAGQDPFCDRVMNGLLVLNSTKPVIHQLFSNYGTPRWDMDFGSPIKSGNMLLVPMVKDSPDSLSLMVFLETEKGIKYKVFPKSTPDSIVTDLILLYQIDLYPDATYTDRIVTRTNSEVKLVTVESCWHVFSSNDGGNTWWHNYSSCRTDFYYSQMEDASEGGGSDSGWNNLPSGGSGEGNSDSTDWSDPSNPSDTLCKSPMLLHESEKLNQVLASITVHNHCMTNTMISEARTWARIWIDHCQDDNGMYYPNTGRIYFKGIEGMNEWSVFEELTHAYQDQFYLGGLAQYGPGMPGHTNMEFEAKLLHAIFHIELATPGGTWLQQIFNNVKWDEVYLWLLDYINNGITPGFWNKYDEFIEAFNNETVYGGFIDSGFPRMIFIENLRTNCN